MISIQGSSELTSHTITSDPTFNIISTVKVSTAIFTSPSGGLFQPLTAATIALSPAWTSILFRQRCASFLITNTQVLKLLCHTSARSMGSSVHTHNRSALVNIGGSFLGQIVASPIFTTYTFASSSDSRQSPCNIWVAHGSSGAKRGFFLSAGGFFHIDIRGLQGRRLQKRNFFQEITMRVSRTMILDLIDPPDLE